MSSTTSGISISVNRGPNWLFLRLEPTVLRSNESLLEQVWSVVGKHFVYRVVLEFSDNFQALSPELIEQLDELRSRLEEHDGALRVCGLDAECVRKLELHRTESRIKTHLKSHATVAAALFGPDSADAELPGAHHVASEVEPVTQDTAYEALRVH